MRNTLRIGVAMIALVAACGGDDGVSIDTNKDNVCSQIAEVACHNMYQCCSEGEIENFLNVTDPRSEAECRDDVTKLCDRGIATLDDAITNKRVKFDATIMNGCLESLVAPTGTCASVESMAPWAVACMDTAWVGLVTDGSKCLSSYECVSADSYCSASRLCVARPGVGQPCGAGCATGLYCGVGGICTVKVASGGMCTSTSQCNKDLFCDTTMTTPTCQALHDAGQACTGNASCKSNTCLPGTCAGTTQSCYTSTQCSGRCADDQSYCTLDRDCNTSGTCSITTTKSCYYPTDCLTADGTCVFPVKCNPGSCTGDIVCADATLVVDYCQDAIGALPFPN